MNESGLLGNSAPIGPGLCRILDMDFQEFPF